MEVPKYTLEFKDITYDVVLKAGKEAGQTKRILHSISSSCVSGRLTALMGPSGAGKSSLLDILAGVKVAGKARGQVLLGGAPCRAADFARLASYVQQKDVLVPSATVREALVTSALLKLPRSMSKAQKLARVDALLELLELSHVAASYIGDEALGIKGISGGEKRRVSVGIELVKDPSIIFLDEPTTGLDSEMALGVARCLAACAQAGKMVVATIHQPNSLITDTFDDWALLAKGRLLYAGPWCGALPYFEAAGHTCPLYRNPTDFFMSLASSSSSLMELAEAWAAQAQQRQPLLLHASAATAASGVPDREPPHDTASVCGSEVQLWQPGTTAAAAAAAAADVEVGLQRKQLTPSKGCSSSLISGVGSFRLAASPSALSCSEGVTAAAAADSDPGGCFYRLCCGGSSSSAAVPFWYEVWVLMARFMRCWLRTPIMAAAEAVQYLILAVFIGLLYLRLPNTLPNAPYDKMSAVFLVLTMLSFTPSYTVLVVWDHERQLLRRESGTNMYRRSAFFLAKTLVSTPIEVLQVSVFAAATYFMMGFQASALKFLAWWATLVLFALASETLGYMAAIVTPDSKVGVAVLSILLVFLLSFSGYLVRSIPVYFAWIPRISYFSFATDAAAANEFDGLIFTGGEAGPEGVPGLSLLPPAMRTGLSVGGNLGVLLGITAGCRLLCLGLLEAAARLKFL
ncbi:hypothetical protein OEZ86_005855 [Tetradesmus obliquus]|nr:hypothetical protein OEZ86_005855 [Tetradesmus obliquus]